MGALPPNPRHLRHSSDVPGTGRGFGFGVQFRNREKQRRDCWQAARQGISRSPMRPRRVRPWPGILDQGRLVGWFAWDIGVMPVLALSTGEGKENARGLFTDGVRGASAARGRSPANTVPPWRDARHEHSSVRRDRLSESRLAGRPGTARAGNSNLLPGTSRLAASVELAA